MEEQKSLLASFVGSWKGICRTWFKPGELADESEIEGEFQMLPQGPFLRHTYTGGIQGKSRAGEETIVFNKASEQFEVVWFDDFHMNYGLLFSRGGLEADQQSFSVMGTYNVGPGHPDWGWRTAYRVIDGDHITITAYNVTPEGEEAKAVEIKYERQ